MSINKFLEKIFQYYFLINTEQDYNIEQYSFLLSKLTKYCSETADHCARVASYAMLLANHLNLSTADKKLLWKASLFHDIGKLSIPKNILNKPSRLSNYEFDVIKTHSYEGCLIVNQYESLMDSRDIVLFHHERYDGQGYPIGISKNDIPYFSRIISVCDSYDAMTSKRAYKSQLSFENAKTELDKNKWKQFDGEIVDVFLFMLNQYKQINGELQLVQESDYINLLLAEMG